MELSWLLLQSRISWSKSSLGQELQEKHFPPQATSLWLHISDTMCSYRTRVSAKTQSRIVHRQINNPLWLVFHLSFMHLNLYSPKSYTYVLKCLQKSQISPLPLGIPSKTCFLLKTTEKKKVQKKCILSPSLSHLVLQTIIREVCVFQRQKYFPLKIPPSSPVASEKAAEANTTARRKCGWGVKRASGVSKRWRQGQKRQGKESGMAIG